MKVYLLKGSKIEGAGYLFKYNEHGHLVSFEAGEEAGVEKLNWLYANLPVTIENLGQMKQLIKRKNLAASITEVKPDLSFQAFWEKYDHKKGRKTNVRRVWEDMEEVEDMELCIPPLG